MDAEQSYEPDGVDGHLQLKPGTGGSFSPAGALRPGQAANPFTTGLSKLLSQQQCRGDAAMVMGNILIRHMARVPVHVHRAMDSLNQEWGGNGIGN